MATTHYKYVVEAVIIKIKDKFFNIKIMKNIFNAFFKKARTNDVA
jgi:hypothetical protein